MRDSYREQLDDILADLVQMCQAVSAAVRSSTTALLEAEIHLAEQVITEDHKLDEMQADIEARAFSLLARQAPVAGELRTLVGHPADGHRTGADGRPGRARGQDRPVAVPGHRGPRGPAAQLRPDGRRGGEDGRHRRADPQQPQHRVGSGAPRPGRGDGRAPQEPVPGDAERRLGLRGAKPPSTWPCSAATTSGSPTTPPRWVGGSSTSSPASSPKPTSGPSRSRGQTTESLAEALSRAGRATYGS